MRERRVSGAARNPLCLDNLAHHTLIHYAALLGSKLEGFQYTDENGVAKNVQMAGRLSVNNSDAYEAACLAGLGIVQAPTNGLLPYLAAGILVEILPEYRAAPLPVTLLYGHRRHVPKRVQAFMDWLETMLGAHLGSGSSNIPVC